MSAAEIWKPVAEFEGLYEVSDLGRVRRVGGGVLKPSFTYGYAHVMLTDGARRAQPRVHVMVCRAFHGPKPTERHQVAHGDGKRSHNRADNLRWATPEENHFDKRQHGTHLTGETHPSAVLAEPNIAPIRRLAELHVPLGVIAEAFGVSPENVASIRDRKTWKDAA